MKTKTMKRLGLFLCSCVMATTATFAVAGLNADAVNASAATVTPQGSAVGTLGADGLYSTSMTQIAPVSGVYAGEVQNVYFEGFSEGTFFLTEFTGKNAPNFAVRATNVYDAWNAETADSAGGVLSVSSEGNEGYEAEGVVYSNGFNTKVRNSSSNWEPYQQKENGKGPGVAYMADDQTYVMIVGGYGNSSKDVAFWGEYYLFTLTDGDLELVNHTTGSFYTQVAAGDKAVIYPSIGEDMTKQISFKYSVPAKSVGHLVDSLSVSYKNQLKEEIGGGLTLASFDALQQPAVGDFGITGAQYVELDMASNVLGTTTWILTDFVGGNAPNIAFGASQGLSTWTNGHTSDTNGTGMMWLQSWRHSKSTHEQPKFLTGTTWNPKAQTNAILSFSNMQNQVKSERYIQIMGVTIVDGADTIVIKTYKVSLSDGLQLYNEENISASIVNKNGGKLVLYGNISDAACGGSCTYALYNPSGISFRYSQPADTIENLIKGLGNEYEYKKLLADNFGVTLTTGSVTIKNEAGETVSTESVYESYTLPASATKGFIGYEVGGKLYGAGSVLTVNSDIVANEVTLDLAMVAGASIRAKEADGHYGGMRFKTTVSAEKMTTWAEAVKLYGVVIPTNQIDGEFEIDETGSKKVQLVNYVTKENENTYCITLTDVYYYNYNLQFSARAYAAITYADGTTANLAVTDYSAEDNARSVYEVAQAALADTEHGYTSTQITFIEKYVNYVVDVTADENGDLVLLDDSKSAYYEIEKVEGGYVVTVKNVPAHLQTAGYVPVSVWEKVEGEWQVTRIVVPQATLSGEGTLVTENFQ